jgi:site-specific recombinase XerD
MSTPAALLPAVSSEIDHLLTLVMDSVSSPNSKRMYRRAIIDFVTWFQHSASGPLSKAVVQEYRAHLQRAGRAPATINLRLTAIRKLATEASDNGLMSPELAAGIVRVKGARMAGRRVGQWLTPDQTEALLRRPDATTMKGKRDRAILGVLIGCALRRDELAHLQLDRVQQRDGRWVIADLAGKGNRVRTVAIPAWAKMMLDEWTTAAGISSGFLLRPVNKCDRVVGESMTAESVYKIVRGYGVDLRLEVAPHDLRRTFAKLAHRGRAPLEQIQLTLGHSSVITTERYLGVRQNLADAPCDHLGLNVQD